MNEEMRLYNAMVAEAKQNYNREIQEHKAFDEYMDFLERNEVVENRNQKEINATVTRSQNTLRREEIRKATENSDPRIHDGGVHEVGEQLYLYTPCSNGWISMTKNPYTIASVKGSVMVVRAAKLIFNGPQYFDSLPDRIEDDPNGKTMKLRWSKKHQRWQESPNDGYPMVAVFGKWEYQPYLD